MFICQINDLSLYINKEEISDNANEIDQIDQIDQIDKIDQIETSAGVKTQ